MGWRSIILIVASVALCFAIGWAISTRSASPATSAASADACGLSLAGSNTIGERLAPRLVAAYLSSEGYTVAESAAEGETTLTATRGEQTCIVPIRSHGSALSFEELTAGTAQIGMSSRAIRPAEIEALLAAGAGDFAGEAAIAEHVVALDGIAIVTHRDNPLRELSREQVRRLFFGEIANWTQLGGAPGAVTLYARDDQSGTFQFFHEHVLEKDPRWDAASANARRFESSTELVASVAADRSGVGFVGMAYVTDAVRVMAISDGGPAFMPSEDNVRAESYPISRRLYLYVRPQTMRDNPQAFALVEFFKGPAAYPIAEELGYVSLRAAPQAAAAVGAQACEVGAPESETYLAATRGADRLSSVVRFQAGSNSIDSLARDDVGRAVTPIQAALGQGRSVRLIGHSDADGDADVNRRLALNRAHAIREAFEAQGLMGLLVESAGERCPVASNETPQGRQSNRRVEIWIGRG